MEAFFLALMLVLLLCAGYYDIQHDLSAMKDSIKKIADKINEKDKTP